MKWLPEALESLRDVGYAVVEDVLDPLFLDATAQKPRTQQLLGWYTRVPASLDDYYRPQEERLYRKHHG